MASHSLALPGVLFVGEDERARLVAHLGPAAGWMIPKGVLGWSHEVSVVAREALGEEIRREAKIVMPEEQIAPARMPLTHQAALKSPLISVSSRLTQKLIDAGIRVHTVGADRVTSSFYYIAEGGGEDPVRVEGDLVAAVGAMLGDRADNAAIERVLDGLVDRLVRSLSRDRVSEVALELAAALPRAAADGTGTQDIDLEAFEKELVALVATSEKYAPFLKEIASKISDTNERKVEIPLYGDARKVSQGPFELQVGEQKVGLVTHERWLATGPLTEPTAKAPTPAPAPAVAKAAAPKTKPEPKAEPKAKPEPKAEPKPKPTAKAAAPTPSPAPTTTATPANIRPLAAPINPPRPASNPPAPAKEAPVVAAPPPEPVQAAVVEAPVAAVIDATPTTPVVVPATAPKQSGSTERPAKAAATSEPAIPKAGKSPASAPVVAEAKPKEAKVEPKPKSDAPLATTPKEKEKGFPWLILLVVLAAAVAVWRLVLHK